MLIHCGIPPQVTAEMALEQQLGVFIGLKLSNMKNGSDIVSFQSVKEMNQFLMGTH